MRSSLAVLCGLVLTFTATLRGQVRWNFTDLTGNPSAQPTNVTASALTAANAGTLAFNATSASSGYTGATGSGNAVANVRAGTFSLASSSYLEVTLTATAGFAVRVSGLSLGTRSTATGPVTLALYSSANNYASTLGTATVAANSTWTLVTLAATTAPSLTLPTVTLRLYAYDGSDVATGNWRIDDLAINATAVAVPIIGTPPAPLTVASGQTAGFTVGATGTGALTYQWRKAGVAIAGNPTAQSASLDLGTVTTSAAGSYDVIVTDSVASATSPAATLTVNKAVAAVVVGAQTATYNGAPQAATATTTPAGLALGYSYTATSGTLYGPSAAPPSGAGTYRVTATVSDAEYQGTGTGTLTIAKAPATVALAPAAFTYDGTAKTAAATTTPAGISLLYTYDGSSTAPVNAGTYVVTATVNHQNYTGSATSSLVIAPAPATITLGALTPVYSGTAQTATATTSPAGQAVTLTYTGTGATIYGPTTTAPTAGGTYSVTATTAGTNYAGSATSAFTIQPAAQSIAFAALPDRLATAAPFTLSATSSSGLPVAFALVAGSPDVATLAGGTVTLTGASGTVTVRATQPGDTNYLAAASVDRTFSVVATATPPIIAVPPADTRAFVGQPVSLVAHVTGAPAPQLQWRKNGADIPGATDSTLTFASPALADTGAYQLVATNLAGTATSNPVILDVRKRPQTIAFAAPTAAYPAGSGITLVATASSGLPVAFTRVSGAGTLSGTTLVGSGGDIVIRATQAGDATTDAAEPVERTFSFVVGALAPFIVTPPADQTVNTGTSVTFRAAAVGTPAPRLQWQKDGADLAGATATTLALASVTTADSGRYTVVATNGVGTASASATLLVRESPRILTQPVSETVFAGADVTLSVIATATPAPTYQWRRNGTALAGATAATLALTNVTAAAAGRYDVVVANSLGTVTSAAATLTVNTRDFSGTYFGSFGGAPNAGGNFALLVRPDGTAIFLGHLPGLQTGLVAPTLTLQPGGTFSLGTVTLASPPMGDVAELSTTPSVAAAPRPVTLRGAINPETGALTGSIAELGATLQGARAAATGSAATRAGLYSIAVIGSAAARGYAVVAADGQAFVFTADGATLDSASGNVSADGRLAATSVGRATVDLTFANGGVTGTARSGTGATLTLAGATEALAGTTRLANLSVRAAASNASPLIAGFVVAGSTSKQVLLRAAGPALAAAPFNVAGALGDPTLQVVRGNTTVAQNDDWGAPAAAVAALTAATTRAGAFPFRTGSNDAALLATLAPGAYTALVGGGNGAALAEVYEVLDTAEPAGARRLVNLSARALVSPGNPLIAGLVIGGTGPQRVLIRGIGPTLAAAPFNLAGTLANPQLTLFRGTTALRTNDDWFRDADAATLIRDAATRAGAFALGAQSLDAALLLFLEPGAYTVQLSGPANATGNAGVGVALVEIYESAP